MKQIFLAAIVAGFLVVCSNSLAVSSQTVTPTKKAAVSELTDTKVDGRVFKGVVKKLDEGTALYTDKAIYPLTGGDFNMIIGKEVNIIGKIVKEGKVQKIAVARVQFDRQ